MEKKVLITGASGLLGRAIYKYLKNETYQQKYPVKEGDNFKWHVLGLCFNRAKADLKPLDLNDFAKVDELLDDFKPDAVIHAAAEKRVEVVEKNFEKANNLNVNATTHLAEICAKRGIMFVYISTDYVFDGKNPPYKINDQTNPLNKYGMSKLNGEKATLEASLDNIVVRVPVLYGHTEPNRYDESAINMLVENVKKGEPFLVDNVQIRYPTHCVDVARFCCRLMIKYFKEKPTSEHQIKGIFHCSAKEAFTKYDMSCIMAELYNLSKDNIKPDLSSVGITSGPNLRPKDVQLDTTYSFNLIDFEPTMLFRNTIKDCLDNFAVD